MKLQSAICDRALAPAGPVPDWVHLFPAGVMKGRDGRVFELADPGGLVLAFQSNGADLPIDYEHQNDRPEARLHGPVPAAGWIKELKADDSGLWGRVEWTATAREMVGRREYRYLSPSFQFHPKTRQIVRLKGAGLVHNPNLHLTALASEEETMIDPSRPTAPDTAEMGLLAKFAEVLGLPTDTDTETIMKAMLAALMKRQSPVAATASQTPDPARFVPIDAVRELLSDRNTQIATMRETDATARVEGAIRDGHITPAMRPWATALCAQDPASFETFLSKSPAPYAYLLRPMAQALPAIAADRRTAQSDEEAAICAQLGLVPGSLSH